LSSSNQPISEKEGHITFSKDGNIAFLDAGWETFTQQRVRKGEQNVDSNTISFAIWIDILTQNIVECSWISRQIFYNPNKPMPCQSFTTPQATSQPEIPFQPFAAQGTPPPSNSSCDQAAPQPNIPFQPFAAQGTPPPSNPSCDQAAPQPNIPFQSFAGPLPQQPVLSSPSPGTSSYPHDIPETSSPPLIIPDDDDNNYGTTMIDDPVVVIPSYSYNTGSSSARVSKRVTHNVPRRYRNMDVSSKVNVKIILLLLQKLFSNSKFIVLSR
jgi:hypothetical protein